MTESDYLGTPRPRRRLAPLLVAVVLAFLLGAGLTALAARRWDQVAALVRPAPALAAAPQPARVLVQPVAVPTPAPPTAETEALATRVATVEAHLEAIDARAEEATGDANRAEALLVAFAARRALDRGQPLGFLETMLRDRFGAADAPAVAQVIAAAQRPVTLGRLQDGLTALTPQLESAGPEEGWWSSARRELGSLFTVRRADAPSAVPADRLERAQRALDHGQVDAAAAEVARLPGAGRAQPWLAEARRYLLARGALDRLETLALLQRPATPPTAG
jgi:hypothetical protein